MISWFNKKQSCLALSIAEAEYVVAFSTICEEVWLPNLLSNLFNLQSDVTFIFDENQICMKLTKNPVFHEKSNHIEIKFHYIRDMVREEW